MRAVHMTPAQQRAQDASVRNLEHIMREAEAYMSARADAAESTRVRLCPCGIAPRACQCPSSGMYAQAEPVR